jgi:hypothetical protein
MTHTADPDFPNLPFVSDAEYATWTEEQKRRRHLDETAEAARIFDELQRSGMGIFEAAQRVPTARANRAGKSSAAIRAIFERRPAQSAK